MKKLVFVSILLVAVMAVSLVGCITTDGTTVTLNRELDFKLEVGEQVDFADYFIITDADGNRVDVTPDMLDLSKIDLSTPGTYVVTLTFGDMALEAIFIVEEKTLPECTEHVDEDGDELCDNCGAAVPNPDPECTEHVDEDKDELCDKCGAAVPNPDPECTEHVDEDKDELCDKCGAAVPNPDPTPDLEALFAEVAAKYDSYDKWNFKAHYTIADSSEVFSDIYYQFLGDDLELSYDYDGETYTEYLEFVAADDAYFYYFDNGDGTYLKMDENHEYFYDYFSYVDYLELYELGGFAFAVKGDGYTAVKPNELGNLVLGEYDGSVWDSFDLWLNENNQISKIVAKATETVDGQSAIYTYTIEFSGYGEADFDIAGLVLDGGETPEPDCTEHVDEDKNGLCDNCGAVVSTVDPDAPTVDLSEVFAQYDHYADWNFFVDFACSVDGEPYSQALYGMMGIDTSMKYEYEGVYYTDYIVLDSSSDQFVYYCHLGEPGYLKVLPTDESYEDMMYSVDTIELGGLGAFEFVAEGDHYTARDPHSVGNSVLGEYEANTWTNFDVYIEGGKIVRIVADCVDTYYEGIESLWNYDLTLSGYGTVDFDVSTLKIYVGGEESSATSDDTVFIDASLSVADGGMEYTADKPVNSFDSVRGLQFLQANGEVNLVSYAEINGITEITVTVATNQTDGMRVSVSVGGVQFTVDGNVSQLVPKTDYNVVNTYTFVSSEAVSGKVTVTLTPLASKKSMYISAISTNGSLDGSTSTPDPEPDCTEHVDEDADNICDNCGVVISTDIPADPDLEALFAEVAAKYDSYDKWNFKAHYVITCGSELYSDIYYQFIGDDLELSYDYDGLVFTEYLEYVADTDALFYYYDNGDGTHLKMDENHEYFADCCGYIDYLELYELGGFAFIVKSDGYTAVKPNELGNLVLGEFEDSVWNTFDLWLDAEKQISKIVATATAVEDGQTVNYTYTIDFSGYGEADFDIAGLVLEGDDTPTPDPDPIVPGEEMEDQVYNPADHDDDRLQDKQLEVDGAIGLPSTGDVECLVVPIQFTDTTITSKQLADLEKALSGSEEDTGWESVKSYYQQASYGKLNLSYNIQPVFMAEQSSSYYESYSNGDETGDTLILQQVLSYLETQMDLARYDTNGDGYIDAIYLVYSAPVNYEDDDSIYWAFVGFYTGEETYDGLYAYYYLFAGFDFMYEDTADSDSSYKMDELLINASTYIHETGHLLGLDDYYDYNPGEGSDQGLGGADMMDATVGDHSPYSKIMLDWATPTVVNQTATVSINPFADSGDCIMVLLDYNGGYFCEYLLIDLYVDTGLNALHAGQKDSYLYDGIEYGVRIYHVSSNIEHPYNDDYYSFTTNNNSVSEDFLIKLIEADGEANFDSTSGFAMQSDLWQAGQSLSEEFPGYTRQDGKAINFDITIDEVSAEGATITITFAE